MEGGGRVISFEMQEGLMEMLTCKLTRKKLRKSSAQNYDKPC